MVESLSRNVGVDYINRNENFEVLGETLNKAHGKYVGIRAIKKDLDFGKIINHKRLAELAPRVINDVHQFLGVEEPAVKAKISLFWLCGPLSEAGMYSSVVALSGILGSYAADVSISVFNKDVGITALEVGFVSSIVLGVVVGSTSLVFDALEPGESTYQPESHKIILGTQREAMAVPALSHEYTHHLQTQAWGKSATSEMEWLREGHARAVENYIGHSFSEASKNPAYEFISSKRLLRELHTAYIAACKAKGVQPSVALMHLNIDRVFDPRIKLLAGAYNLGSAVFSIAQEKHGVGVNRDIVKGDFSFLSK